MAWAETYTYVMGDYTSSAAGSGAIEIDLGEVQLRAAKGDGTTKPALNPGGTLGVYAKGTLTVSSTMPIYEITFGGVEMAQLARLTASTGKMSQGTGKSPAWSGEANEVTFTVSEKATYGTNTSKAGQLKFYSLSVTLGQPAPEIDPADTVFTQVVDLYYGHWNGVANAYTNYNHQLWFTSAKLEYDGEGIIGEYGHTMRLDLFTASATDITGTYTIVDPKDSDKPGCINKSYSYYSYFDGGLAGDYKLTIGILSITCQDASHYIFDYDVQEIDGGTRHHAVLTLPVSAITYDGAEYQLTSSCGITAITEVESSTIPDVSRPIYNLLGQPVSPAFHGIVLQDGYKFIQ